MSYKPAQQHVMYVLICQHVVMSSPYLLTKGRTAFCPECGQDRAVKGVHAYEWRVHCPSCQWSRWTGTSEMLAKELAAAHSRSRVHPTVHVEYVVNPAAQRELTRLVRAKAM